MLVIRFSALGDVAMLVPVIRATAEQYPDVQITMLSQQRMADLFADMPANVLFHGVDTKTQSLRDIYSTLDTYEYVADMHGVWRSRYIRIRMHLHGARVAVIHKGRVQKFLLTHGWRRQALTTTVSRYADVLSKLGFAPDSISPTPLSSGEGIGIAPFAAHQGKMYPTDKMEQVVCLLSKQGEHVVLFGGGEKEKNILDQWASVYPNVENTAGRYTLREEMNRMAHLRVMLTMDSANMHLASLVGTRVISIWGATHPYAGFLGYGQQSGDCIQRDLSCRPCSIYGNRKCRYGDYRCMFITPEDVVARLLNR